MFCIGICDDDAVFLAKMQSVVMNHMNVLGMKGDVLVFQNAADLQEYCENDKNQMHLLFMDIVLGDAGEENGIALANLIHQKRPNCEIAFVTNYSNYATDAYEAQHCYFLLKDEVEERLPSVFKIFLSDAYEAPLVTSFGGKTKIFHKKDILYIERGRQKSKIVTVMGDEVVTTPFLQICEHLDEVFFLRCHNSYVVNMSEIHSIEAKRIVMSNGAEIPVSRSYQKHVQEQMENWIKIWI